MTNGAPESITASATIQFAVPAAIVDAIARMEAELREVRRDVAALLHLVPAAANDPLLAVAAGDRLLREAEVAALVGYSPRTLRAWVSAGKFPRPIRQKDEAHRSTKRWLRGEVDAWIAARARAR